MKICVVGSSKRFFSGITTHTIFLANALSKRNDVSVILLRNLLPRFLFPGREHVGKDQYSVDFNTLVDVYEGMDYNSPLSWLGAYRFIKKHRPDAIIILWWTSSVAHMQIFLKWANRLGVKAKVILEMHEVIDPLEDKILPIRLYSRIAGRMLVRGLDEYTTQSSIDRDKVIDVYRIDANMVHVVPVGLYEDYAQPIDRPLAKQELGIEKEFVILYFGLIRHYKGVPYLIEAFNRLPSAVALGSRLLIVGETWEEKEQLEKMVEDSPYKSRITLVPKYVPDSMILKYFSAADVIALPYLRASGSGVAHIALPYGRPIILSDVPSLRESLGDYPGSIFVKPGDSNVIRESIETVYQAFVSGKELRYTCNHDSWDDIARRYENIIGNLLAKGKTQ